MEPEGSLPFSQETAIWSYPEPHVSDAGCPIDLVSEHEDLIA